METASIELWHGSSHVIKHPEYGLVKPNNDYGRGFYCTRRVELAKVMELVAESDDAYLDKYFSGEEFTEEELQKGITIGRRTCRTIPRPCPYARESAGIAGRSGRRRWFSKR